jgi:predicted aconitase with swiveling domain
VKGEVLVDGSAEGPLLRLAEPLSFWGGVDPMTGRIIDPRHPQHGEILAGCVLALATRGSSSSSSVLLELLARGCAPAAILLAERDALLALGVIVAREMGYGAIPVLELGACGIAALPEGRLRIEPGGRVVPA